LVDKKCWLKNFDKKDCLVENVCVRNYESKENLVKMFTLKSGYDKKFYFEGIKNIKIHPKKYQNSSKKTSHKQFLMK